MAPPRSTFRRGLKPLAQGIAQHEGQAGDRLHYGIEIKRVLLEVRRDDRPVMWSGLLRFWASSRRQSAWVRGCMSC
jgi:hypothetical protein